MDINNIMILAIIVTSLATFSSRFLGVLTSEKVSVKSKVFQWFNCVAYSILAALLGRMIIFPAGVLADSDLIIRIIVLITCVAIFILTKKNLVLPTIFSAVFLSILTIFNKFSSFQYIYRFSMKYRNFKRFLTIFYEITQFSGFLKIFN